MLGDVLQARNGCLASFTVSLPARGAAAWTCPVRDDTARTRGADAGQDRGCPSVCCSSCRFRWRYAVRVARGAAGAGSVQHELPLAARAAGRGPCCRDRGGLPWTAAVRRRGGRVRGPGHRRARLSLLPCRAAALMGLRAGTGDPDARRRAEAAAAPPGLCRSCGATHVLLPSGAVPRRADAAGLDRGGAAIASARRGAGSARLGTELGVPAATVRGWLRRLRARSGTMSQDAMATFGLLTAAVTPRTPSRPGLRWATRCPPSSRARSPRSLGTATGIRTWTRCWASSASPPHWRRPPPDPGAPARASPCPEPVRDAHHDHPAAPSAHVPATMSIPATPRAPPRFRAAGNARFQTAHRQ